MLRALASPYQVVRFMPTEGFVWKIWQQYLRLPNVLACGGSWICPGHLVEQNRFDQVTDLCRQAVKMVHQFQLLKLTRPIAEETPVPVCLEDTLGMGPQRKLVLGVNHVARALAALERLGYTRIPDESGTAVLNPGRAPHGIQGKKWFFKTKPLFLDIVYLRSLLSWEPTLDKLYR